MRLIPTTNSRHRLRNISHRARILLNCIRSCFELIRLRYELPAATLSEARAEVEAEDKAVAPSVVQVQPGTRRRLCPFGIFVLLLIFCCCFLLLKRDGEGGGRGKQLRQSRAVKVRESGAARACCGARGRCLVCVAGSSWATITNGEHLMWRCRQLLAST